MYQGRNRIGQFDHANGCKNLNILYFDVARILMKEENVVNWQPYWANLIMQNGCGNVNLWNLRVFICLSVDFSKKVAILASKLASKLATLSAEFDHANKLGAKM
jgi:hypothetical protein